MLKYSLVIIFICLIHVSFCKGPRCLDSRTHKPEPEPTLKLHHMVKQKILNKKSLKIK